MNKKGQGKNNPALFYSTRSRKPSSPFRWDAEMSSSRENDGPSADDFLEEQDIFP